jgi:formylglycine-generating enzyme required for sulfatase activity
LKFVEIPAGVFDMGSTGDIDLAEQPAHRVSIDYSFNMGETEVTQAHWKAVMGSLPAGIIGGGSGEGNDYPVYRISWDDCQTYITALNALGLGTFRLPSEAEWEYACRAGTTTELHCGNSVGCADFMCSDCEAGTQSGNISDYLWYCWSNGANGHPTGAKVVAQLLPNQFRLYDMHGNINEWVQDSYHASYAGAPADGSAWEDPLATSCVLRGGQYVAGWYYCGSARRVAGPKNYGHYLWGFRLVWKP